MADGLEADTQSRVWYERVASESNIADGPSRGDVSAASAQRDACLVAVLTDSLNSLSWTGGLG